MRRNHSPVGRRSNGRLRPTRKFRERLAVDQIQHFRSIQNFALQQRLGDSHQRFGAPLNDLLRLVVAILNQLSYLLVDLDVIPQCKGRVTWPLKFGLTNF
jgi:hypothetical protein